MSIDQAAMNFINQHNALKIANTNAALTKYGTDVTRYGIDTRAGLEQQNIDQRKKLFDLVTLPKETDRQWTHGQDVEDVLATDAATSTDTWEADRQETWRQQKDDIRKLIAPEAELLSPSTWLPALQGIPNRIWDSILNIRPDRPEHLDPRRAFLEAGGSPEEWDALKKSGLGINLENYTKNARNEDLVNDLKESGLISNLGNPLGTE